LQVYADFSATPLNLLSASNVLRIDAVEDQLRRHALYQKTHMKSRFVRFLAPLTLFSTSLLAQNPQPPADQIRPHEQAPTAVAARRNGPISIDGKLDEAAWQAATPITDFKQFDPQEGQPATEKTEARILIDDDAVYVGMRMFDSEPSKIQSQLARRDESIEGDLVEVTFDSFHDHLSAVIFRLSAGGARRDATISPNGNQDNSWDAVWEGHTTVDAKGWTAEFRIPLSQLRYNRNVTEQVWGLQLGRKIARKAEIDQFSYTPKSQQQGINRYGHLAGLGNLRSVRKIELVPYVLAKNDNPAAAEGDPFHKKNELKPGAGLDAKIGLTSNLTLDATFNPDFGQVEVDPAVVNLSAFETFFPERRPFFVEGSSIFSFGDMRSQNNSNGFTFFHTRRIGRQPQRFVDGPDIAFVDTPGRDDDCSSGKTHRTLARRLVTRCARRGHHNRRSAIPRSERRRSHDDRRAARELFHWTREARSSPGQHDNRRSRHDGSPRPE
jgi:hypothetical protein